MKNNLFIGSLVVLAMSLISLTSQAEKNPQMRHCRHLGGKFSVAKDLSNDPSNEFGFCSFKSAVIGSIDLLRYADGVELVSSIETYASSVQSCEPFGHTVEFTDFKGKAINICVFEDGSLIGLDTLKAGLRSPLNDKLNEALGLN